MLSKMLSFINLRSDTYFHILQLINLKFLKLYICILGDEWYLSTVKIVQNSPCEKQFPVHYGQSK